MTRESDSGVTTVQPLASCETDRNVRGSSVSGATNLRVALTEHLRIELKRRQRRPVGRIRAAAEGGFGTGPPNKTKRDETGYIPNAPPRSSGDRMWRGEGGYRDEVGWGNRRIG